MTAKEFPYRNLDYFPSIEQLKPLLESLVEPIMRLPEQYEIEKIYLLAVIRRSLSILISFRHSVEVGNEQMAATILRLHLDTLARTYALCWADETPGMTAESFAKDVLSGAQINKMKLRGSKEPATDKWLIKQISVFDKWIENVYTIGSGAVHFSSFHMSRVYAQSTSTTPLPDGSLRLEIAFGGTEKGSKPEDYAIMQQAFCHTTAMLLWVVQDRCGLTIRDEQPSAARSE